MEYAFIVINPLYTLNQSGSTSLGPTMDQIDLFNKYSNTTGPCAKTSNTQKYGYKRDSLTSCHEIKLDSWHAEKI